MTTRGKRLPHRGRRSPLPNHPPLAGATSGRDPRPQMAECTLGSGVGPSQVSEKNKNTPPFTPSHEPWSAIFDPKTAAVSDDWTGRHAIRCARTVPGAPDSLEGHFYRQKWGSKRKKHPKYGPILLSKQRLALVRPRRAGLVRPRRVICATSARGGGRSGVGFGLGVRVGGRPCRRVP